jgi:DnaJ-domain-containing protein 1
MKKGGAGKQQEKARSDTPEHFYDGKSSSAGSSTSQSNDQRNRKQSNKSDTPGMADGESCADKTEDFNTRDDQLDEAYQVLGVSAATSDAELKKAYRNLASQYHPDKLVGQGLPSFMIQSTTECFQAIQSAYEYIREARKK